MCDFVQKADIAQKADMTKEAEEKSNIGTLIAEIEEKYRGHQSTEGQREICALCKDDILF